MVGDPTRYVVLGEQFHGQPFGSRTGTRTDEHEHLRHLGCTTAAASPLVGLEESVNRDLLVLKCPVEYVHLSFNGAFEDGQRHRGHRESLLDHDVGRVEGSPDDHRPLLRRTVPASGSGDGDRRRPFGHEAMPPRRRESAENGVRGDLQGRQSGPGPCGHRMIGQAVDAGTRTYPLTGLHPPGHRGTTETVLAGLRRSDHAVAREDKGPQFGCSGHAVVDASPVAPVPLPAQCGIRAGFQYGSRTLSSDPRSCLTIP